jgi:hypothetical protein
MGNDHQFPVFEIAAELSNLIKAGKLSGSLPLHTL